MCGIELNASAFSLEKSKTLPGEEIGAYLDFFTRKFKIPLKTLKHYSREHHFISILHMDIFFSQG